MINYNTVAETDGLYASPIHLTCKLIDALVDRACRGLNKCPEKVKEDIRKLAVENFARQFKEKRCNLFGKDESFLDKVRCVRRYTRIDLILHSEGNKIVEVKFTPMIL